MKHEKYKRFEPIYLPDRTWPNQIITKAPIWCSVDLRDGNQSLEVPMTLEQKLDFFTFLVKLGFKTIEVGFPAASDTEFEFTRRLIEDNLIPDDVSIQVLTQAREHIIERTFEALEGVKHAVVHVYNSTSTLQREVVFGKDKEAIKQIAIDGATMVRDFAEKYGKERFTFEYSPESFTGTELDYAIEVCNAVIDVWQPTPSRKVIINLPSTVEMATPNVYADQIEYVCRHISKRDSVEISLHAHNDRGTGVAATELAIMAGADRVEGTLFGNGERTGNADILNIAMNLFSQGIDPELNLDEIDEIIDIYEKSTMLSVHPRHPYAGRLVFTAFSGSHQDAINKGLTALGKDYDTWEVPYLPIDPAHVGRSYDPIIRINSQSGKGGVAYILEAQYGFHVPKYMQPEFGKVVTEVSDKNNKELAPSELLELFENEYVNLATPIDLIGYSDKTNGETVLSSRIIYNDKEHELEGHGQGVIEAFTNALTVFLNVEFEVENYHEHAMEYGSKSRAVTYVKISNKDKKAFYGVGISTSISKSSLRAIISAVNKMLK